MDESLRDGVLRPKERLVFGQIALQAIRQQVSQRAWAAMLACEESGDLPHQRSLALRDVEAHRLSLGQDPAAEVVTIGRLKDRPIEAGRRATAIDEPLGHLVQVARGSCPQRRTIDRDRGELVGFSVPAAAHPAIGP